MAPNNTTSLRITLAQLNPTMGDLSGNATLAQQTFFKAVANQSHLVVFSELFITGYPPEDLILKPAFQQAAMREIEQLAKLTKNEKTAMLVGTPWVQHDKLFNAVALLAKGKMEQMVFKRDLPNYSVFDEKRLFEPGPLPAPIAVNGIKLGVPICEDIWSNGEICQHLAKKGAQILITPNGSPFSLHKQQARLAVTTARISETGLPLLYVNQVGGQDELVFDGASYIQNADQTIALQGPTHDTALIHSDWQSHNGNWFCQTGDICKENSKNEAVYGALVLGLRDYVQKNGFPGVVLGLSGGIDSAICAAIAVDALGADKVHCVMLPYRYTSDESLRDAKDCADMLGVKYDIIPIEKPVEGFLDELAPVFASQDTDTTEENLQSRTRGVLLMALSNKFGAMLVTTGNKSEMSVGYATIYGDMNGGFNPIKDVYKMQVFELCKWRNEHKPAGALGPSDLVIPTNIITKPPSAELREDQRDDDSLPPYEVLDDILSCLVEEEMSIGDILKRGHDLETIKKIEHLLYIAEYKRRQAAPGIKITSRNFGRDRRYPITNRFRDSQYHTARK